MNIIIITGTPGCGKTSVSNQINKLIDAEVISLNELVIKREFTTSYDDDRDTYVVDFDTLIPYLVETIKTHKEKEDNVLIIEGHFSDIVPDEFIDLAIILRCHPDELSKRLKNRDYKSEKILENIQSEILANCATYLIEKNLKSPIVEIDTTNLSIKAIADVIIDIVSSRIPTEKYKIGSVDWLELLFSEDRMDEFFD